MDLYPATAREALLQIRLEVAQSVLDSEICGRIEHICKQGLDLSSMSNFELTDQLADRLAQAHDALARLQGGDTTDIAAILALPPDLDSMIERRRKTR